MHVSQSRADLGRPLISDTLQQNVVGVSSHWHINLWSNFREEIAALEGIIKDNSPTVLCVSHVSSVSIRFALLFLETTCKFMQHFIT